MHNISNFKIRPMGAQHSFCLLLMCCLLLISCKQPDTDSTDRFQIAVIPKSVNMDFWSTVHEGALAAADSIGGIEILWKGTSDETDIAGQITLIETFLINQVDAIVVAATDAQGLVPVLKQAIREGIPVITIDSNTDPPVSSSFVATDNEAAARSAAQLMAEMLDGKGKVALIPHMAGSATSNERENGFKDGLLDYPGLQLVATRYSNSDNARAMQVTEDLLTGFEDLDGIFATSEPTSIGVARALEARSKNGEVVLISFDAAPQQIEDLRTGVGHALIVQNPFAMGFQGVVQAHQLVTGNRPPARIDTGVTLLTRENIDAYVTE